MFKLTDDYKIGITDIDEEHAYLVRLINEAMEALKKENPDIPVIAEDFIKRLKDYAEIHFANEEAYMEKIEDPELPRQRKEHKAFFEKVNAYGTAEDMTAEQMEELLQFMVRWLFGHILASDMMIGKIKPIDDETKDPFAFRKEYETGIKLIDDEHKVLFEIIRKTNDLIHAEYLHDKYDAILDVLDELREYTEKHFSDEEEYMTEIGYPRLEPQQMAHSAFVDKLVHINMDDMEAIDENQQGYLMELINYLLDWLANHILYTDKQISEWLNEKK